MFKSIQPSGWTCITCHHRSPGKWWGTEKWVSFLIQPRSLSLSPLTVSLCPPLTFVCAPSCPTSHFAVSWRVLLVWRWKDTCRDLSLLTIVVSYHTSDFSLIWIAWACVVLELGVSKRACWGSWMLSFPPPVVIVFPLVVGKVPHRMMALWTALSFDGKEHLPNREQPEIVSFCCSENYSSWLPH